MFQSGQPLVDLSKRRSNWIILKRRSCLRPNRIGVPKSFNSKNCCIGHRCHHGQIETKSWKLIDSIIIFRVLDALFLKRKFRDAQLNLKKWIYPNNRSLYIELAPINSPAQKRMTRMRFSFPTHRSVCNKLTRYSSSNFCFTHLPRDRFPGRSPFRSTVTFSILPVPPFMYVTSLTTP